jgi:DNA polymerase III sliding clamp (beta) subunit (PCNA family)
MKVSKAELQAALEKVKPGLASKEMIEQSTSFAFVGDRVVTYNDEISISHPVKGLNVKGAVKAQTLYSFLSKIRREEIDVEWEENQVKIKAGKAKAGLVFESEVKLPIEEVGAIGDWKPLPEDVLEAMRFCHPCCSKDMSRPILTCVHVSGKQVEASDSYQIIRYQLEKKVPVKAFLIPASAVRELIKYDIKQVAEGDGWIHFKTEDGTIFSSRIFEGSFPDVGKFLEFDGVEIVFPKNAIQALERARVFAKSDVGDEFASVDVEISETGLTFASKDTSGWFEESAKSKYKGDPIKFTTGVDFLINLLGQVTSCIFGEDKIKFTGEKWAHVVATTNTEAESL